MIALRRLAKNVREDAYGSSRDYQDIITDQAEVYELDRGKQVSIIFDNEDNDSEFVGIGCYFKVEKESEMQCTVLDDDGKEVVNKKIHLTEFWKRFGLSWINNSTCTSYEVEIKFDTQNVICYGLSVSGFDRLIESEQDVTEILNRLNAAHMAPESFYLSEQDDLCIKGLISINYIEDAINLKKCSYCQRYMLVGDYDSSFHKHAAKKSGFQNECRSCKALRINDSFNPMRTVDQLNESSVITRERKILLREPQILEEIKNRHSGEGLKSLTWKKFDKRCFNCNEKLKLKEVQLDHTRPLAYLWPLDEYATCLCGGCNNSKHDKFPVEFYTESKLIRLSEIIGLDLENLRAKKVNEFELSKIVGNIEFYFDELDWKTFKSIRNKVISLKPETDLYEILKNKSSEKYEELLQLLTMREEM